MTTQTRSKEKKIDTFLNRVKGMTDYELVATYQYVGGLFARQEEQMHEGVRETAKDMNVLKDELLYRLSVKKKINEISK